MGDPGARGHAAVWQPARRRRRALVHDALAEAVEHRLLARLVWDKHCGTTLAIKPIAAQARISGRHQPTVHFQPRASGDPQDSKVHHGGTEKGKAHMALTVGRPRRAEKRSAFRHRMVVGYVVGDVGRCERLARRWRKALRFSALRAVQQSTPYERKEMTARYARSASTACSVPPSCASVPPCLRGESCWPKIERRRIPQHRDRASRDPDQRRGGWPPSRPGHPGDSSNGEYAHRGR